MTLAGKVKELRARRLPSVRKRKVRKEYAKKERVRLHHDVNISNVSKKVLLPDGPKPRRKKAGTGT